jgi:membrane-associated HD superfamily phosphohydrolase
VSPHEELSNEESARIIKNHVLHGVDRARRYKLPDQIIDFIRTHHGTGKIGYFYAMAQKEISETPVDERLYTYPGPEPFSKETCVLMMSDAVEAASRSLKAPSEHTINELVDKIVNNQIQLKQFENADITFKDISSVKEVLKRRLKNMYHVRIDYPAEALK